MPTITDPIAAARALGVSTDKAIFPCPLPGHDGVAELDEMRGEIALWCDCHGAELKYDRAGRALHHYALSDAYYSVVSGVPLDRQNFEVHGRFVWRMLLLEAAGMVEPVPVDMAYLPADAPAQLHAARVLCLKLAGMRLALADCIREAPLPFPLSEALVRDYCRLSVRPRDVINGLIEAKVLRFAGRASLRPGQARSAFLYEPVSQRERSTSNDRGMRPLSSQPSSHR